jgi:hypothetical protein
MGVSPKMAHGSFDFLHNPVAMTVLSLYVIAYSVRIYIMNYYKNTRGKGVELDNRGFFGVEQISASVTMLLIGTFFALAPGWLGWQGKQIVLWHDAVRQPDAVAMVAGLPYALVAFFSVFIFMFKGRTATFAGLVNRLTSLLAGTTATLILWAMFKMKFPTAQDWVSAGFILIAVYFLTKSERMRTAEMARG